MPAQDRHRASSGAVLVLDLDCDPPDVSPC